MQSKLVEMLHLDLEPVGIYFGNTEAECDVVAEPGKRNCVVPFLLSAARGKVAGIAEVIWFYSDYICLVRWH